MTTKQVTTYALSLPNVQQQDVSKANEETEKDKYVSLSKMLGL